MGARAALVLALAILIGASCADGSEPTERGRQGTTPTPTPTPAPFTKCQSNAAIEAFADAGLEVEGPRPMTRDDYGAAPLVANEGTRFLIPSLGEDSGGRVLSFETPEDRDKTKEYYDSLGRESAMFYSHTFVKGNLLVQINGELSDDRAAAYDAALQRLDC